MNKSHSARNMRGWEKKCACYKIKVVGVSRKANMNIVVAAMALSEDTNGRVVKSCI